MSEQNNGNSGGPANRSQAGGKVEPSAKIGRENQDKPGPTTGQHVLDWLFGKKEEGAPPLDPNRTDPLQPHGFQPEVELLHERLPRVLITPEAYRNMCLYVEIAQKEVGWMGTVSRTADGDFLIEDTFLLEQLVHSTETELASEDIGKLTMRLIDSGADGLEKANKLRFWGHSHVRMGTSPSGTDERTMERFGREGMPWYVRGIFNKEGRGEFTVYLYERGMRINDSEWQVWDPRKRSTILRGRRYASFFRDDKAPVVPKELTPTEELRASVEAEFAAKVKERRFFWDTWNSDKNGDKNGDKSGDKSTDGAKQSPSDGVMADGISVAEPPAIPPNPLAEQGGLTQRLASGSPVPDNIPANPASPAGPAGPANDGDDAGKSDKAE
jgi:hypothetical protein